MSEPQIAIRRLGVDDVEEYRAIRLASLELAPAAFSTRFAEEVKRPLAHFVAVLERAAIFAADDCGALVGVARLEPGEVASRSASINGVFILPDYRGHGLGQVLLGAVIAAARPGTEHLTLSVIVGNRAAIALYRSLGFRPDHFEGRTSDLDGSVIDQLHMRLPLPPSR